MSTYEIGQTLAIIGVGCAMFAGFIVAGAWLGDKIWRDPYSVAAPMIGAMVGMLTFITLCGLGMMAVGR